VSSHPRQLVFVGNFLPDRQESMLRFERALVAGLSERGHTIHVVRPEPRFVRLGPAYRYGGLPKYLGYLDKFFVFPRRLRRLKRAQPADTVFHILDHGSAVYVEHLRDRPLVVTVHDLLQIRSARGEFPQNRLGRSGARYQEWILANLKTAPRAACISKKTATDLQRLAGLADDQIAVVPVALNYPYSPLPVPEAAALLARAFARQGLRWPAEAAPAGAHTADAPPAFLFAISGAQWYKNRTGLLRILAALRRRPGHETRALVYVGPAFDAEQQAIIAEHGLRDAVLRVPGLDNEELRAAYSLAAALLFPSWEEGFGWPIAEAQACGCPVFASGRAPMTEVGGDAARYFDPTQPDEAATVIAAGLADPQPLRAAGLVRTALWAPRRMLDAYEQLYTRALGAPINAGHRE
jgi:glycosyltransferase involved in cell wall biosynthesis